jgi:hypothetical protein
MSVATPIAIPINENHEIIDNKPSDRNGLRYLKATNLSK